MTQHTRNIILDTLVLVAFSSVLGGLSLLISKSFSGEDNPALNARSLSAHTGILP